MCEAQAPPACTQPIWELVRLWVRGKRGIVWWWGEGKRPILRVLPKLFWEVRPARMTDHPKEARLKEEPLGACHER